MEDATWAIVNTQVCCSQNPEARIAIRIIHALPEHPKKCKRIAFGLCLKVLGYYFTYLLAGGL